MPITDPNASQPSEVAAAVIEQAGQILISKRADSKHQGGKWEFPGGKLEAGETARKALSRELEEELGIVITDARPLIQILHHYPDKSVRLSVFKVTGFSGTPKGLEGQPILWVNPSQLNDLEFPPANFPIIQAAQLPEICAITPPNWNTPAQLIESLKKNLPTHELAVLRLPEYSASRYTEVATVAAEIANSAGMQLLLTSSAEEVVNLKAGGLHLNSKRLMSLESRPITKDYLVSTACHSAEQLKQAEKLQLDFVFLSPVKKTNSHPDASPIGWSEFSALAGRCQIPVYALGGVELENLDQSFRCGAQGIAGISRIWQK